MLAFLLLTLVGLNLAICESLKDDVINASSTATAGPIDHEYTTDGSNCSDVTSNSTQTNQSDCSTEELEGHVECGVCTPRALWTCRGGEYVSVTLNEDMAQQILHVVIYVGFSVSLVACIIANAIYVITRRGLKSKRSPYHIHWNLIGSFTIYHVVFLIDYSILPSCYVTNMHVRNLLNVLLAYTVLANFFWMLVEGMILFCIVVKSFFQDQEGRQFIKWCLLGWGTPLALVIIWIVGEKLMLSEDCAILELEVAKPNEIGIACLVAPVFVILLINGIVLVTVIRNISKKLKSVEGRDDRKRHRRTARSTLVLLILLGSYYVLPILFAWIGQPCLLVVIVYNLGNILSSLQGLAVSTLYVFLNGEVQRILSKRFAEMNVSFVTGSTRLSSPSLSNRNSSSSGSDGRQGRRSTPAAVEMITVPTPPQSDMNSNMPADRTDGDDNMIIVKVDDTVASSAGATEGHDVKKKKTRAGAAYSKLDTTDPDA